MTRPIILASGSSIRRKMLENAGLHFDTQVARIDEEMITASLLAEEAKPRDIADLLAQMKSLKISEKSPESLVIGSDQILDFEGVIYSKPETSEDAIAQICALQGKRHTLYSAAVISEGGKPIWRHVGQVRMQMRPLSDEFIAGYVARNWESIKHACGAYKLEEEGSQLFSRVEGDYFNVLGMPLLEILSYLILRGDLKQ